MTWLAALALTISLKVTPQQAFGPVTERATVTIEPHPQNVAMCLEWDSENESGLDCRTLEHELAPKTTLFLVPRLPAGDYIFEARVYRGTQVLRSNRIQVHILSKQ